MIQIFRPILLSLSLNCIVPSSQAAIEFYRFQGSIAADADVAALGLSLSPGQSVYFDFAIETTPLATDWVGDLYPAALLRGTTTGYRGTTIGFDSTTPEATTGNLFTEVTDVDAFRNGAPVQGLLIYHPQPLAFDFTIPDFGVGAWSVGQSLLLRPGDTYQRSGVPPIGELSLTYRAADAPPPIPLPASVWLLAGAAGFVLRYGRRTRST